MKALLIIFTLLLILLIAGLWVGPGSYPDRWRLDDRKLIQEQENKVKEEEIRQMQAELDDAASSKDALEERARSELGMTKKGETFFEVIMTPDTKRHKANVANESPNIDSPDKKTPKLILNKESDQSTSRSQGVDQNNQ